MLLLGLFVAMAYSQTLTPILSTPIPAPVVQMPKQVYAEPLIAVKTAGASVEENVYVNFEYLTDDQGNNYGANYFLSSNINTTVWVYPYIYSQENVYGSVTSGPVLMQANESHFSIGSFICADRNKAWSVNVQAKWKKQ